MLEPWIETYSGKKMYFLDPKSDMIDIKDIAHSLSLQCRFSGHTRIFYSVAEHCIRVSKLLYERSKSDPQVAMQGLLHDATEAYLLDVPSPVKQYLGGYYAIEDTLANAIFKKYGAIFPYFNEVKVADTVMLKNEARNLIPSKGSSWLYHYPTPYEYDAMPFCLRSVEAENMYIAWFNFLENELEHECRSCIAQAAG